MLHEALSGSPTFQQLLRASQLSCTQQADQQGAALGSMSNFQAEVLRLCQHQPGWQVLGGEHLTDDGMFSIDVAVLGHGADGAPIKVAVEVDGPWHFTRNKPFTLLGHTTIRNRSLQQRGWQLLSVPFYDWYGLNGQEAKSSYLAGRLNRLVAR